MNTCLLYDYLVVTLGTALDPYIDILLSNILCMASFAERM